MATFNRNAAFDERIPYPDLTLILRDLRDFDVDDRVKLLTNASLNNDEAVASFLQQSGIENKKRCWIELLVLIGRYDLLNILNISKQVAYEQTKDVTYFKDER